MMLFFRAGVALFGIALVGCTTPVTEIETGPSYRDQSVPIGVTSRFDEVRFLGDWAVRQTTPGSEGYDRVAFSNGPNGLYMEVLGQSCDETGICGMYGDALKVSREGNGRYLVDQTNGTQRRFWVLWVDEGFRTAIVGNPEGTFAWVLDRSGKGGADRITAAREILDFNGYDVGKLKVNE